MLYQGGTYFDSHCTILKPQNTSLIAQTTILTWENTILNPQNTILKPQNTSLISQTTILTLENTIPNPQNTILKPQNTICLDSNHHEQLCLCLPLLLWWFAVPNQTGAGLLSTTSTYSWVITSLFTVFLLWPLTQISQWHPLSLPRTLTTALCHPQPLCLCGCVLRAVQIRVVLVTWTCNAHPRWHWTGGDYGKWQGVESAGWGKWIDKDG